jgi:hypothetical protein
MRQIISQDGPKLRHDGKLQRTQLQSKNMTTRITQQLEGHPAEPEVKKPRVQPSEQEKPTGEEEKTQAT